MKNILLDTNAYAAFKKGDKDAVEILRLAENIALNGIVLGELLAGFALGGREMQNRKELSDFLNSTRVKMFTVDAETADFYVYIFLGLRRKGNPIPTNDIWIAANAMQYGYAVFSHDKHFSEVEGLLVCKQLSDILP